MSGYQLRWITDQLAVGHAPMSFEHLKAIKEQGISAIVNLCGEYCDLHEIEDDYGFDVFYLPIADEDAPDLEELDRALDWLDEAIYLGKKVLVHCRFGIGRTGTFVTSYLLRCGFGLKSAKKRLKRIRSSPSSYRQWRLLRKYGKREGQLKIREPSLESKHVLDLGPYFTEYEALAREVDSLFAQRGSKREVSRCGSDTDACCGRFLFLQFIEAAYLSHYLNKLLSRQDRLAAIQRAIYWSTKLTIDAHPRQVGDIDLAVAVSNGGIQSAGVVAKEGTNNDYKCPLNVKGQCLVYEHRPIACRLYGIEQNQPAERDEKKTLSQDSDEQSVDFLLENANRILYEVSRDLFFALNGVFLEGRSLLFPLPNVISGKFVQDYFLCLRELGI